MAVDKRRMHSIIHKAADKERIHSLLHMAADASWEGSKDWVMVTGSCIMLQTVKAILNKISYHGHIYGICIHTQHMPKGKQGGKNLGGWFPYLHHSIPPLPLNSNRAMSLSRVNTASFFPVLSCISLALESPVHFLMWLNCMWAVPLERLLHFSTFRWWLCFRGANRLWRVATKSIDITSLVPRPTCTFHFSAAVGLVYFLTCVTRRVEGWIFAWVRRAAVLRQRWKAANLYFLQLLFEACLCHRPSAETMIQAESREVQLSFERSLPTRN